MFLEKSQILFQNIVTSFSSSCLSYFYEKEPPFPDSDLFANRLTISGLFEAAYRCQPNINQNHNSHHHSA
jgi:hypothetical protein